MQGLGGRTECGNGGAARAKAGGTGNVWEVVSALASALASARDQLVTLMHNSTATRMTGGCNRHTTPARSNSSYPGAGTWVRNVHRAHAHGHVAFGCSSEYRLHPSPVRVRQPRPLFRPKCAEVSVPPVSPRRSPARCRHPLHKMQVDPSRSPSPWPPQVGGGRSRPGSRPVSRCGGHGRSEYARRSQAISPRSAGSRKNLSPEQPRHCIGTQYVALLREEAYQLRERRMAEEIRRSRRPFVC